MTDAILSEFINAHWEASILPTLQQYIAIPNKSPHFDPDWQAHGYMDQAVNLLTDWCKQQSLKMNLDVIRLPGRTPLIFIEIPGNNNETILMYGHMDKQPEMKGWDEDLHPWKPVLKGDKLYGRGGADDGYAIFASLTAILALQKQGLPHARCVIIIEACEESGSYDLPHYIDALESKIGKPNLVICLDSGCGNYNQLWMTTSLRGLIGGELKIDILKQGIHSGQGSGIVPSCFLVLRQLLNRIEDETTGKIIFEPLLTKIPEQRIAQAEKAADVLQTEVYSTLPFVDGAQPVDLNVPALILNRTWRPALSITGAEGLPAIENAGNVALPSLTFKLSLRLAPNCDAGKAAHALKNILEQAPPFGAKVTFTSEEAASGWNAPLESDWLINAAESASQKFFGEPAMYMGEGGSIPFMGMLGEKFPEAQFVITGVLGPRSNAHGPNEFLHIPMAKKLTACIADIVFAHYQSEPRT